MEKRTLLPITCFGIALLCHVLSQEAVAVAFLFSATVSLLIPQWFNLSVGVRRRVFGLGEACVFWIATIVAPLASALTIVGIFGGIDPQYTTLVLAAISGLACFIVARGVRRTNLAPRRP